MEKIVVLAINYNTPKESRNYIDSIKKQDMFKKNYIEIYLIDNSNSFSREEIEEQNIFYLNPKSNLGYFGAAQYGYQYICDQNILFDWIIVTNVDLFYKDSNSLDILCELDYRKRNLGVIAPSIMENGIDRNPFVLNPYTKKQIIVKKLFFSHFFTYFIYNKLCIMKQKIKEIIKKKKVAVSNHMHIYMPYGAQMIFSKLYFEKGCNFSYPIFLYGEELFIGEECLKNKIYIEYINNIKIENIGHVSVSKISKEINRKYQLEAYNYILDRFRCNRGVD